MRLMIQALLLLACVAGAAMRASAAAVSSPAAAAAAAAAAGPAAVMQLDMCNKHKTSEAPGTTLTYTKDGMCVLTSQVLTSCAPLGSSAAVVLRFPCSEGPREKQATGPALNVWASLDGVPRPTKRGVIVNEVGPAQALQTAALKAPLLQSAAAAEAACSLLTLHPGLYYHRSPPVLNYGYSVSGVPCSRVASASAATSVLEAAGAKVFPTTYSIWLKPAVPAPPKSMSTEQQACHLVISVLNRSYTSADTFACAMQRIAPEEVGEGCCYNAGGAAGGGSGRRLLSAWERRASYRRAMQH